MIIREHFFDISLPSKEWKYSKTDNICNFFNYERVQGVLQISVYIAEKVKFDVNIELEKTLPKYPNALIHDLGNNKCVHYAIYLDENEMIRYDWIFGKENIKLYATLLLNANQDETIKDSNYNEVLNILRTIKLKM